MTIPSATRDEMLGRELYGDRFSPEQIQEWYDTEVSGFFDLLSNHYQISDAQGLYSYEYDALNRFHAFRLLSKRCFDTCLALGCAAGDDIAPLASVVQKFIAIEPARKWWRDSIGGKPASYLCPSAVGDIPLAAASVDLVTSIGALHHIPNVSHLLEEISRVLCPGGLFVLREPISSMGDWRRGRVGLTAHERGLPIEWLERAVKKHGFLIHSRRLCMFNPVARIANGLGMRQPFTSKWLVRLDSVMATAFGWNKSYWRDSVLKKLAPSSAFWILVKRTQRT